MLGEDTGDEEDGVKEVGGKAYARFGDAPLAARMGIRAMPQGESAEPETVVGLDLDGDGKVDIEFPGAVAIPKIRGSLLVDDFVIVWLEGRSAGWGLCSSHGSLLHTIRARGTKSGGSEGAAPDPFMPVAQFLRGWRQHWLYLTAHRT